MTIVPAQAGRAEHSKGGDPSVVIHRGLDPGLLSDLLEPALLKQVIARLQPIVGRRNVPPGRTVDTVNLNQDLLQQLLAPALVVAAGLERAKVPIPPPPVLWDTGTRRLLVHLDGATLRSGPGFVDITLNVECDETKVTEVVCTFVTTTPDRPGGFVWATEDRPRGPAIIVDLWGDALVALCWRALIEVTGVAASSQGSDTFDRPLIASTVIAGPDGLQVTPMAAHRFMDLDTRKA